VAQQAELGRSFRFKDQADLLNAVKGFLAASVEREKREFAISISRVMAVAEIIPLTAEALRSAVALVSAADLQLPDAIVAACVLGHLDASFRDESCFLNRDRNFRKPYIAQELANRGCKMLFNFADGANYLPGSRRP